MAQALRPFPQYQNINQLAAPAGTSLYHSMQLNVQKRFGHGFSLLAGYTISKQLVVLDAGQQHTEVRAKTLYRDRDRAQMLSLSYVWDLPFGSPSNPVLRQIIGGWQISGIHNYMSGTPVAVSTRASLPGGFSGVWANRVNDVPVTTGTGCGSYDPGGSGRYLNIDAFSTPGPYSIGNTGVLPDVRTCGYLNESFSVQKSFFVREGMRFRIGADFFNIFNRHVWTNLNADINNPEGFGRFGGATDPRSVQLFLRFEY